MTNIRYGLPISFHMNFQIRKIGVHCPPNANHFEVENFMKQQHWLVASHFSFGDWKLGATVAVQKTSCKFSWLGFRTKNSPARGFPLLLRTEKKTGHEAKSKKDREFWLAKSHFFSGTELGEDHLMNTLYITSWWLSPSSAGCAYMRRASKSAVTGAPRLLGKLFRGNTVNRHQL